MNYIPFMLISKIIQRKGFTYADNDLLGILVYFVMHRGPPCERSTHIEVAKRVTSLY